MAVESSTSDIESQQPLTQSPPPPASTSLSGNGVFWLVWWFLLNIGLTLMNKALFQFSGFSFPVALSLVHMLFSCICSRATLSYLQMTPKSLDQKDEIKVALFSVLFCANIMVGNLCLKYVSVSLVQVVRSIIPGITLILSVLILGKSYERIYYYCISFLVFGVALASFGEINLEFIGLFFTLLVCFLSSLKSVISSMFLVGSLKFHPFDLLYRMSMYSIVQLVIATAILERQTLTLWWHENGSGIFLLILSLNGFMAFFLNWCNFMTTKMTSALTVTVAGNVKHIATIVVSIILFSNPISLMNALGTTLTVVGAGSYSYIEFKKSRH